MTDSVEQVEEEILLFIRQNHLLALVSLARQSTLLSVFPNVVLTPFDGRQLFTLDLRSLLNGLRHVALSFDPSDLRHMRVSVDEGLVVLQLRALSSTLDSAAV